MSRRVWKRPYIKMAEFKYQKNHCGGFSLIEILVVVAIFGLLSSILIANTGIARSRARDERRRSDLQELQLVLALYRQDHDFYPVTNAWWGISVLGGNHTFSGPNAYIPGVTPNYISVLPVDPLDIRTGWSGYLYNSNGTNYKLLSHQVGPETFPVLGEPFFDPIRPTWAWMVCDGASTTVCNTW